MKDFLNNDNWNFNSSGEMKSPVRKTYTDTFVSKKLSRALIDEKGFLYPGKSKHTHSQSSFNQGSTFAEES
jgi:hypothetical protein